MNKTHLYIIYNAQQNFLYLFLGNTPSLILSCQTNRTLLAVHNVCCQCPSHSLKPLLICFFALVVLNCFVSNQHCFSIRSYLFSENAELFGKLMTSPGKFSSDETFMSTCTWNRLATPCPLTSGIQIYFSPPLVISLVKSSMLLMAHFNSCTNNIIQYTTSELQQICHRLLGDRSII